MVGALTPSQMAPAFISHGTKAVIAPMGEVETPVNVAGIPGNSARRMASAAGMNAVWDASSPREKVDVPNCMPPALLGKIDENAAPAEGTVAETAAVETMELVVAGSAGCCVLEHCLGGLTSRLG